jgi:hypothetical protein
MALINIDSILLNLSQKLKKLKPPQGIELLSYKRNRSVAVLLLENGKILVREKGYHDAEHIVKKSGLQKLLKALVKYEFPRSRKLRMYQVDAPEDLGRERKKL